VALEARPGTGLTTRPFAPPAPARTIGLVWRATSPNDTLYREVGRLLADSLVADSPAGPAAAATPGALSA